jgi:hypothetical protein
MAQTQSSNAMNNSDRHDHGNVMISVNWKTIAELIGMASIVASLVLVAYELRKNTAVATAEAVRSSNMALDSAYRARAENPVLDALIENGHSNPASLSERERSQFFAWLRADMNGSEATWFSYNLGIIPGGDFDGFIAGICSRVTSPGGRAWWDVEAKFFAAGFREAINNWCFDAGLDGN